MSKVVGTNNSEVLCPILAAEDDENDAFILRRVFERIGVPHPLVVVRDGREAVDYLDGQGGYSDRALHPLPCLLLLDLKMPRMDGFEVLAWLSERPQFKSLPVVVLSASCHEPDIQKSRQMGAWDFYIKPMAFEQSIELIQKLLNHWLPNSCPASLADSEIGC